MKRPSPSWLEEAVFYQIYPQTFYDSNGDGIGDLPGIIQKLDYLASLGVNAIWLNPCFESPFNDAGYDISDFYKVASRYGSNDDLARLFQEARQRGLRVLLDLVPGHTSIAHPWFKASGQHEHNSYSDWYIWTDSVWQGAPPGFEAVRGLAERDASYLTNYFYFQPALNYGFAHPDPRHPWQQPIDAPGPQAVRQEMIKIMKYWLDLGASGFRVDMAASLVKNDPNAAVLSQWWQEVRAWLDQDYPEAVLVSEWSSPKQAIPAGFHIDFYIHFNVIGYTALFRKPYGGQASDRYGWSFFDAAGHGNIRAFLDEYLEHYQTTRELGDIALATGNHDIYPRLSYGRDSRGIELAFLFLLTMPGMPFIYYGDEIGLRTIDGLPSKEGGYNRTGARTPMQWDDSPNAGFSSVPADQLYLPVDDRANRPTVAGQENDPSALLNRVRRMIALRKSHPALCASGDFEPVYAEAGKYPFIYSRSLGEERILVALNPADRPVSVRLPTGLISSEPQTLYGESDAFSHHSRGWTLRLPGVSGGVYRLT